MDIDCLIIGQGLAGSLLAWELMQRQRRVVILDSGLENASQVAAGLINPVTGLRFVKADTVDTLLACARRLYRQLSDYFQQSFLIERPMLRLLRTENAVQAARKRLHQPDYQSYLGNIIPAEQLNYPQIHLLAALEQKQTGYLLTRALLNCLKDYFINRDSYRRSTLDYRAVQTYPTLQWQDLKPRFIIFCEGFRSVHNPWFGHLPWQPVKGQILTFETDTFLPEHIVNDGHWLLPTAANRFRIGATFERNRIDTIPTETGKQQLLHALCTLNERLASATLIEQQANIRPCSHDRQPFIGQHPQHPELWLFNGFGAKGSLQIPWYSEHLADTLLTGAPLRPTCNINRL